MNNSSRLKNSLKNSLVGLITQFITIILGFINRSVFIYFLSVEYLGISGVFTNLLTMISLAELGVGSTFVYSMYKPIAEGNKELIKGLMNLYAKAYKMIALTIAIIGLVILPYIDIIVGKDITISNIKLIYLLYLSNTVISYLFSYKRSIISADQRDYINLGYKYKFNIIKFILQMIFLYFTKNYIIYLFIQIICTLSENIVISQKTNKLYPFLKEKNKVEVPKNIKDELFTNIKATMIYKVSGAMLDGTDNLIISSIVGVVWVGLLANYNLIVSSINTMVSIVMNSIRASLGNFIAKETKKQQEDLLYIIFLISFFIYGTCSICLLSLINPFIEIWLGEEFLLNNTTLLIVILNFYIIGMQGTMWMYRSTMGLFKYGKWRPVLSAFINIFVSVILGKSMGLIGVLLGTTIARVLTNVWYDPIVIFKYGFNKSSKEYYLKYIKYIITLIITGFITINIMNRIIVSNFIHLILKSVLCVIITNIIFIGIFKSNKEFKYVYKLFINIIKKYLKRGYKFEKINS